MRFPSLPVRLFVVPITLATHALSTALVDSGTRELYGPLPPLHITTYPLSSPFSVQGLDCRPLGSGAITHITQPLTLTVEPNHQKNIPFITIAPVHKIILGQPWLQRHNPTISWSRMRITDWSHECRQTCLPVPCGSTSVESPVVALQPYIPEESQDLREVFTKTRATCLPPHRPWDCPIDLYSGATPPRRCIYPLSVAETQTMEDYIQVALQQGFIRRSTSPASAGFYFVAKKEGGLGPCIDYRGLDDIATKYRTLSRWCHQLSSGSAGSSSSPNWTCGVPIISFASRRG